VVRAIVRNMRKVLFALALSSLAIAGTTSAEAAPKASAALKVLTATYKTVTKVTLKF
jgi:hypothetical protein